MMQPVVEFDRVSESDWNQTIAEFADGGFYQSWAYGAISWGDAQLRHCVIRDERSVRAVAQVRVIRLPVVRAGVAYVRWGPACWRRDGHWDAEAFAWILDALVAEFVGRQGLILRIIPEVTDRDPHAETARRLLTERGLIAEPVPPYRTIRVDLTAEPAVMRKRFDGKWRNQLNAAERNSLEVVEGTGDDLYEEFVRLYDEMMARKQFETTVNVAEFGRIQRRLPPDQRMIILISRAGGVPQTGLIGTALGRTGVYLLGATSNEGMKSKGSYLLQWRMMNRLREAGCHWYDLGGINPETNPGVYHFKQGMGGEEVRGLGCFSRKSGVLGSFALGAAERFRGWRRRLRRWRAGTASL